MHRSGSSALTRTLNLLGFHLGADLLQPMTGVNDLGFWEQADVVDLNQRMLRHLGSSWFDPGLLPERWWERSDLVPFLTEIQSIVVRETQEPTPWVVKDPRLCRLLPAWNAALDSLKLHPRYILIVRNPWEAAASLARRDFFQTAHGLWLWLCHVLESEKFSHGRPRVVVTYDQLLRDWRATVERIAAVLDFDWPVPIYKVASALDEFLKPDHRHHRQAEDAGTPPERWIRQVYEAFKEASCRSDDGLHEQCRAIHGSVEGATQLLGGWLSHAVRADQRVSQLESSASEAMHALHALESRIGEQSSALQSARNTVALQQSQLQQVDHALARAEKNGAGVVLPESLASRVEHLAAERDGLAVRCGDFELYVDQLRIRIVDRANGLLRRIPWLHRGLKLCLAWVMRVLGQPPPAETTLDAENKLSTAPSSDSPSPKSLESRRAA
jgi:hypothetical protein